MKQLSIILILATFHMLPLKAHGNDPLKPLVGKKILVEIGQFPGCYLLGICRITFINSHPGGLGMPYQDSKSDNILLSEELKSFEIQLSRDRLLESQPDKLEYLDGKSSVTFTQGYDIPVEVESALNASRDLMIRPGTYPLTFIDGIFTIKFPY